MSGQESFLLEILQIVMPVFLILGIGYFSVRFGYISSDIADSLNAFTVKIAVPVLLFRAMYKLDFSQAFDWPMLVSFYAGAVISFIIGITLARVIWNRRPGEAVAVGFCALFSNTVLLGIPIVERAYGAEALTQVFGIISLHAPCLYALGMTSMELSRRDGRSLGEALLAAGKSILQNSLMTGIIIGVILNLTRIPLPEVVTATVDMIAISAIPVALIGIGTALTRYSLKSELSEAMGASFLSLFIHPLIAFILSFYVFNLSAEYVRAAVIVAAMPPGINVYIFASMYNRAVAMSASTFLIATPFSILTIAAWLSIVKYFVG